MPRSRPLVRPVPFTFDGERALAEEGEPVAAALVALGKMPWARSPKFHRPRGPACFRGACDGCLARVDGAPNVMTCMTPLAPGMEILTQNTLGSRTLDLYRVTDWFFPDGFNHHELFAGVTGAQTVMELFARRVAGLGRLPSNVEPVRASHRRRLEVLVVGAGPAGMATACALADRGRAVEVVDEQIAGGGSLASLHADVLPGLHALARSFDEHVARGAITLRTRTSAGAVFGRDVLVSGTAGVEILDPETLVLATGAHDGVLAFEGNDLPGVMSARAGAGLLARSIRPGDRVLVCAPAGASPFTASARRFADAAEVALEVVEAAPARAEGSSRVRHVHIGDRRIDADVLLVDCASSPSYELSQQAGAKLVHEPRGFVPVLSPEGKARDRVFVVGEASGAALTEDLIEQGRAVATSVQNVASAPR